MKNKTFLSYFALLLLAFIGTFLVFSTNASAQRILPDARAITQCYNSKLKASGKYVNCILRAERNANRNMTEVSEEDIAQCHERFERRFNRAEAQAAEQGAQCPTHGGLVEHQKTVVGAASTINSVNDVKTLIINIPQDDIESLLSRSQNLIIAIKVNGEFNVIWRSVSSSDLNLSNEFQWSQVFHIFGASSTALGDFVTIGTNVIDIALGQDVVFNANNLLETPVTGNSNSEITFMNNSSNVVIPGLAQQFSLNFSTPAITSIYVGNTLLPGQSETITPTQEVMVWFDNQELATGTIFAAEEIVAITTNVDLTNVSSVTLNYSNGQWSMP